MNNNFCLICENITFMNNRFMQAGSHQNFSSLKAPFKHTPRHYSPYTFHFLIWTNDEK